MTHKPIIITGFLILTLSHFAIAQQKSDTVIANQNIEIVQTYTPEVKMPPKPEVIPTDPDFSTTNIQKFDYDVPSQLLQFKYDAVEIKPLALGTQLEPVLYQNSAAIGLGNFKTFLADVGLTYHEDAKYDAYIHGFHFSQRGGEITDRKSALTSIRTGGKYFLKNYELFGDLLLQRRGSSYYGYNHDLFSFNEDDINQAYNLVELKGGLGKMHILKYGFGFQPSISMYYFNGKQGGNERGFGWQAPLSYGLSDQLTATLSIDGMLTGYNAANSSKVRNNSYVELHPSIKYNTENFTSDLGIAMASSTRHKTHIIPKINLRYAFGDEAKAAISGGWDGNVVLYTFKEMALKNPFILNIQTDNAIERKIYGGFEFALLQNLEINAKASFSTFTLFNNFINDYSYHSAGNYFTNQYNQSTNVFSLKAGAQWLVTNIFELGGGVSYFSFPTQESNKVLHEPGLAIDATAKVKPIKSLTIFGFLDAFSGMKYQGANGEIRDLDPAMNLSFKAQYDLLERFGLFMTLDNILNNKYQRWHQYDVYGFNIFGGVKVKF